MTSAAPSHQLREVERLFGDRLAMLADPHEDERADYHGVEPFDLAEALCPKDHANVGSIDLGSHFCNAIFWKTMCVRSDVRHLHNSHCKFPALVVGARYARGNSGKKLTYVASEFASHPTNYGDSLFGAFATGAGMR